MAGYNAFYPYQGGYYSPYQQPQPQSIQQANGFISVRSMEEAINWPMAPGTSLTFKDESAPYIYTKTKGFSQLEQPIFERFRLVKEEQTPEKPPESPETSFDAKGQIETLWSEIATLKAGYEALREGLESSEKQKGRPAKKQAAKEENESDS